MSGRRYWWLHERVLEFAKNLELPMHELLGIPFTAKARLKLDSKRKALVLKTRTDLATAKLSNIQARDKLKAAKAKLRDARACSINVTAEYQPELDEDIHTEKFVPLRHKVWPASKSYTSRNSAEKVPGHW